MRVRAFPSQAAFVAGPLTIALGSMGAGGVGGSLSYQELVNFSVNVSTDPILMVDLLDNNSLGKGFDSATFQISENGTVLENKLFTDLASAEPFFFEQSNQHHFVSGSQQYPVVLQ